MCRVGPRVVAVRLSLYRRSSYLTYGRLGSTWCVQVKTLREYLESGTDILEQVRPLLSAPRDIRLAAAEHVGELLDALASAAKEKIASVKTASSPSSPPPLRLQPIPGPPPPPPPIPNVPTDVSGSSPVRPGTPVRRT